MIYTCLYYIFTNLGYRMFAAINVYFYILYIPYNWFLFITDLPNSQRLECIQVCTCFFCHNLIT